MSAITTAIYNVLSGDSTLTNLLGSNSFFGSSRPSIFTKEPLPPGFKDDDHGPYIIVSPAISTEPGPYDTKNSTGLEVIIDVRCYADRNKTTNSAIDAISLRVRTLFHRVSITVVGYTVEIASVSGPVGADEDKVIGRIVSIRLVLQES